MGDTHISVASSTYAYIPPHDRLEIQFRELSFAVKTGKTYKPVLKNLTGRFRHGRLTVILGSSGAGKTSLLSLIAGEAKKGLSAGEILVNGNAVTGEYIRKIAGFVHQEDIIMDTQNVQEAIRMSAMLRLPNTFTPEQRMVRVEEVIGLMHLENARETLIGNSMIKGVSGGEKKRTAIAMELVTNPMILFLDEPTSGLDAYSAYTTLRHLKDLAETGRTIVATLHQPSSEIFHLLDDLMLMANGGIIYCGPAADSIEYFSEMGFKCPQYSNPADFFFMNVLNNVGASSSPTQIALGEPDSKLMQKKFGVTERPIAGTSEVVESLLKRWPNSVMGEALRNAVFHPWTDRTTTLPTPTYMANFIEQFRVLMIRAWHNAMRNKLIVKAKLAQIIFMSVLIDIIFWQIPKRNFSAQIQDRAGVLFFLIVNSVFSFAMGNLTIFSTEKIVFQREFNARMYGLPAYFFSKVMVETPFLFIIPIIYILILYFAVGFQNDVGKFLVAMVAVILMSNCGSALGLWAASTFPSLTVALAAFPLVVLPLMIFTGLFVNLGDLPGWISWFKWLSPMKYGFVALMKNEFDGLVFGCGEGGVSGGVMVPISPDPGPFADPYYQADYSYYTRPTRCVPQYGEIVIKQFGLEDQGSIAVNILALLAFTIALISLSYLGLFRLTLNSRSKLRVVDQHKYDQLVHGEGGGGGSGGGGSVGRK